ncbi:MAG: Hsp20/alpha crystallin family protein [Thermoplasmata archaeon]|nr:MAG: Hsp20/alpha crystallin family protein [Thermoplasmata archaeon]
MIPMESEVVKIVSMDYDEEKDSLLVEVPLPSADKESIDLHVYRDWFVLRALRTDKEDADYLGEFNLCCAIDQENVTARYEDDVLSVWLPLDEEAARPKRVDIN